MAALSSHSWTLVIRLCYSAPSDDLTHTGYSRDWAWNSTCAGSTAISTTREACYVLTLHAQTLTLCFARAVRRPAVVQVGAGPVPHAFAQHRRQGTALPGWGRAGPTRACPQLSQMRAATR